MNEETTWRLGFCAGYIVPISKGKSEEEILHALQGSAVKLLPSLQSYFLPMLRSATTDYPVDVLFESDDRHHPVRDSLLTIAFGGISEQEHASRFLATRLARVTDQRSDEGLLIVLLGCCGDLRRIAIWKFPTDESIRAKFTKNGLTIDLIQDGFSRESRYFKAAVFEGPSDSFFWSGKVEDKQATGRVTRVSELWLDGFLKAKIELKDKVASRTVGEALRRTIDRTDDQGIRERVIAVAVSLTNQDGDAMTYGEVARRLPVTVRELFLGFIRDPRTDIPFTLQASILEATAGVRIIQLDNGFSVRGPAQKFREGRDAPVSIRQFEGDYVEITVSGTRIEDKLRTR